MWIVVVLGLFYIRIADLFILRSIYFPGVCPGGVPCSYPTAVGYLNFVAVWVTPTMLIASIIYLVIFATKKEKSKKKKRR